VAERAVPARRAAAEIATTWLRAVRGPAAAIAIGFLVSGLLVLATGKDPISAGRALIKGSVGSPSAIAGTLSLATPLLFSALAFAVAFRGSMFNAGVEGQLLMGAFAGALVGFSVHLPAIIHIPLMLFAGMLGGAFWAFLPAIWRVTLNANEVVTTLMMNFIAVALTDYFVLYPFRAPGQSGSAIKTQPILATAELPRIWPPYNVTIALPIAILCCIAVWYGMRRLVVGYEVRMVGTAPGFARASGIDPGRRQVAVMLISGALAGLGGAAQVGGVFHAFISPFAANLGFNGVLVALLVGNSAIGIPPAGAFIAALQSGAITMELTTTISRYIVGALIAIIIVFVSARRFGWVGTLLARYRHSDAGRSPI
jgi:general nucleoside transport system permease protein